VFGEDKTVIRGGFRVSYDPSFYNMFLNVATSSPSVIAGQFLAPLPSSGFFGSDLQTFLAADVPTGQPAGRFNHTIVAPNFHNPYSEQWNLGVQRSFGQRVVGEVRYVGNHGVGLFQTLNGNPALSRLIKNGFGSLIPTGLAPCTTGLVASTQGYANCEFRRVVERANTGWSKYHSLQTELRIGQWHGLTSTVSYTWSHTMDNASEVYSTVAGGNTVSFAQNPFNSDRGERANSGIDFPNLLGITFIYDFPFAKSQHGFAGKILGGWQMNTTYRYSTGQPYTTIQTRNADGGLGASYCDSSATMSGTYDACRPVLSNSAAPLGSVGICDQVDYATPPCTLVDYVAYTNWINNVPGSTLPTPIPASQVHWISNDNAYALSAGSPYLGAGRNSLRGQAISSANLAFFKTTKLNEKVDLQFQAQAFNVLNTQFLGVPDPILDHAGSSFQSVNFNARGGASSTANGVYDGIGRRRLLFGAKVIF